MQSTEKDTLTMMDTKPSRVPPKDPNVLAKNVEVKTEDNSTDKDYKYLHVLQHKQSTNLCWVCGKRSKSLKVHLQTHSKNLCKDCNGNKGTESDSDEMKEGLGSQETTIQTLKYLCWVCGTFLNSAKNLREHLQTQHKDSYEDWKEGGGNDSDDSDEDKTKTKIQPTDYLCWVCGTFMSSAETLMAHLQTHNEGK